MFSHSPKKSLLMRVLGSGIKHKWVVLMLLLGAHQFGSGSYIYAKAVTAQWLIKDAWDQTLRTGTNAHPWAWADTWPVAKLTIMQKDLFVLSGASGRTLAFGPGHLSQTALPGESGNVAIAGHRDTHFRLLKESSIGDVLTLQHQSGTDRYHIIETRIVHQDQVQLLESSEQNLLTLITCYPFNSVDPNTELRFVVRAEKRV